MKVYHVRFGKGVVVANEGGKITVAFEDPAVGEKRFAYPDAFESFLRCEDEAEQKKAIKLLEAKRSLLALAQAKRQEEENARIRELAAASEKKTKRTPRAKKSSS
ncbi:MAG: hypothetical protein IJY39_00255 [Clostridia bacterium]|nr:hypothetical protein [Clostridia bacterium]MBQ9162781.1 hypothetical protein [Clostridia bacterium]